MFASLGATLQRRRLTCRRPVHRLRMVTGAGLRGAPLSAAEADGRSNITWQDRVVPNDAPAHGTDAYFQRYPERQLAVGFSVDLGELVHGHHIVARGLEFGETGALLHYDFVPGVQDGPLMERVGLQRWSLQTEDDVGTEYNDPDGGAFAGSGGPAPTHGERDLGGYTPSNATRIRLTVTPAPGWQPPSNWVRTLSIDLASGQTTVRPG